MKKLLVTGLVVGVIASMFLSPLDAFAKGSRGGSEEEVKGKSTASCQYVSARSLQRPAHLDQITGSDFELHTVRIENKLSVPITLNTIDVGVNHLNNQNYQSNFDVSAYNLPSGLIATTTNNFVPTSSISGKATLQVFSNMQSVPANGHRDFTFYIQSWMGQSINGSRHGFSVTDVDFTLNSTRPFAWSHGCPNPMEVLNFDNKFMFSAGSTPVWPSAISSDALLMSDIILYESGKLQIEEVLFRGKVIAANTGLTDVLGIKFTASLDDIIIDELYLENDVDENEIPDNTGVALNTEYRLFDDNGSLLQVRMMNSNGQLEFDFPNANSLFVPKNGSRTLYVKTEVRPLASNSFERKLKLSLDANNTSNVPMGVEAITGATGVNLTAAAMGGDDATSNEFVIHNVKPSIAHATTQPTFMSAGQNITTGNAIYRFQVAAAGADSIDFKKITFDISSNQGVLAGGNTLQSASSLKLYRYPNSFYSGNPVQVLGTGSGVSSVANFTVSALETVINGGINYYELRTTESITNTFSQTDKVSVQILADSNFITPSGVYSNLQSQNFVWNDRSQSSQGNLFQNGYLLDVPNSSAGTQE
jgi:hypothetical protein